MKYPFKLTIYTYSNVANKATYTKGVSFKCYVEQSPSKTRNATGATTAADAIVGCSVVDGAKLKKQDRMYIERGKQSDVYDVIKPEQMKLKGFEIYAKLNSQVAVNTTTGVMS